MEGNNNRQNYAWPVTSMNQEDYEAYENWYREYKKRSGKIAIFGAGIRGTEFYLYAKDKGIEDMIFVDNNPQKWGGVIDNAPIMSPEQVFNEREREIVIAVENCDTVVEQLVKKGYEEKKSFFVLKSNLYQNYVEEFGREYKNEIMIFGDCEFSKISLKDSDRTNLAIMMKNKIGKEKLKILAMHGMGIRSFFHILTLLVQKNEIPQKVLVQVNFDTLNGKQHLLPRSQHTVLLQAIYDRSGVNNTEFENYLRISGERNKNLDAEFQTNTIGLDRMQIEEIKAKNYFRLNYMYKLDTQVEGLIYLKKMKELCIKNGIVLFSYVPPVNYIFARQLMKEKFDDKYERNRRMLKEFLEQEGIDCMDLSYLLSNQEFAEPNTPDETANVQGRKKLLEKLCSQF